MCCDFRRHWNQPTIFNRIDEITKLFKIFIVVGCQENRFPLGFEHSDNGFYILIGMIVQCIERFIQHQNILPLHDSLSKSQLLLHAKRIVAHLCFILRIKGDFAHCLPDFRLGDFPLNISQKFQILKTAVHSDETRRVDKNAHIFRKISAVFAKVLSTNGYAAGIRFLKTAKHFEQNGLTASIEA